MQIFLFFFFWLFNMVVSQWAIIKCANYILRMAGCTADVERHGPKSGATYLPGAST